MNNKSQSNAPATATESPRVVGQRFNTDQVIILARKHLGGAMESSARLLLADANEYRNIGNLTDARACAIRSLRYSVGILSPVYAKVGGAA